MTLFSQENRVRYNQDNYQKVFAASETDMERLKASEEESSLSECVQRWLERTPGLEEDGFDFPLKFREAVDAIFDREEEAIAVSSGCMDCFNICGRYAYLHVGESIAN